ncbi:hypothetical protein N5P37_003276 [Trichoderma harzianum]|nr:hypothetical protein N5P37_003276 [Trichoderma harzianum]
MAIWSTPQTLNNAGAGATVDEYNLFPIYCNGQMRVPLMACKQYPVLSAHVIPSIQCEPWHVSRGAWDPFPVHPGRQLILEGGEGHSFGSREMGVEAAAELGRPGSYYRLTAAQTAQVGASFRILHRPSGGIKPTEQRLDQLLHCLVARVRSYYQALAKPILEDAADPKQRTDRFVLAGVVIGLYAQGWLDDYA